MDRGNFSEQLAAVLQLKTTFSGQGHLTGKVPAKENGRYYSDAEQEPRVERRYRTGLESLTFSADMRSKGSDAFNAHFRFAIVRAQFSWSRHASVGEEFPNHP